MVNEPLPIETKPIKQRATRVQELEPGIWLYSDGVKRNAKGQTLEQTPALKEHAITRETAYDMARLREQRKHEVMARALNREVQPELLAEFGEYAFMAEGAINMQRIATSPEAGKAAVMAFDTIMEHTGHGKRNKPEGASETLDAVAGVLRELAAIASTIQVPLRDAIDGVIKSDE